MTQIAELIERWNTAEGRPFRGSLIDTAAYEADPNNIGCMCAQGQVLHLVAGWSAERLRDANQDEADAATAKLLRISRAHAVLLRKINDSRDGAPAIVLTNPSAVLGPEWSRLLDFWWHLDQMTAAARDAAWDDAGDAARLVRLAEWASLEIQGAAILRNNGRSLFFLPAFGFASPEDIPARPADYGVTA